MTISLFFGAKRSTVEARSSKEDVRIEQGELREETTGIVALTADEMKLVAGGDYNPTPKGGW